MVDKHPGLVVMIKLLGGNEESVATYKKSVGRTIESISLEHEDPEYIKLVLSDNLVVRLLDSGQSCCESRYITSDDDLPYYSGAKLLDIEIVDAPDVKEDDEYSDHEVQFLKVITDKGTITFETHNIHNGYYGGFYIELQEVK